MGRDPIRLFKPIWDSIEPGQDHRAAADVRLKQLRGTKDLVFRQLDRAVIEGVHAAKKRKSLPEYGSVQAAFVEGEPLYPHAGFHGKNHIQICVRKQEQILGYFRPRKRIVSA